MQTDETKLRLTRILTILETIDQKLDIIERDERPGGDNQISEIRDLALAGCARLDAILNGWGE